MPLSDKEVKELLERAESYLESATKANIKGSDDLPYLKEALMGYGKIIESVPSHPYYYLQRSDVEYRLALRLGSDSIGRSYLDSAIDDISKAIELEPDNGVHYGSRGLYSFEKLSKQEVMDEQLSKRITEDYHTCLSKNSTHPQGWLCLLSINLILGNYDEAISIYGQCKPYINDKENQLIRAWLGCITFILAGDSVEEDIKPLYNQEIRLNSATVTLIQLSLPFLKKLLENQKNEENSKKINEINELIFSHINNTLTRAHLLSQLGRFEEALDAYEKALELEPDYVLTWNNKGTALMNLNRYEEALMAFNKAIEVDSGHVLAWHNKGVILNELGCSEEALEAYNKVIELDPTDFIAWNDKSTVLVDLKRFREALEAYEKAIELSASNEKNWPWGKKGWILLNLNRYEEALCAFDKLIEFKPGHGWPWGIKGYILWKLNRYEEALVALDKAIEFKTNEPDWVRDTKERILRELNRV